MIAARLFGADLDPDPVRVHRAKWWPLQPKNVAMAPDGHLWFHPGGWLWREDYAGADPILESLFAHELTHVWQHQQGLCLPLRRHPFCRYRYRLIEEQPLEAYGIEQQAMIVQHAHDRLRRGEPLSEYAPLLPASRSSHSDSDGIDQ